MHSRVPVFLGKREKMNHTETFQRKENYIHRTVAGQEVLISIGGNIANFNGYIRINESALCLWEKLSSPCTREELARTLTENYGLPEKEAEEDAESFLRELVENGMVIVKREEER